MNTRLIKIMVCYIFIFETTFLPKWLYAQSSLPPNHTLPQYNSLQNAENHKHPSSTLLPRLSYVNQNNINDFLSPNTIINSVYADGSNGTLQQIGRMADRSVQQEDIGKPNGVAQLDRYANLSAIVKVKDSSLQRSLSEVLASEKYLQNYMLGDGNGQDMQRLDNFVAAHCGSVVHISEHFVLPTDARGESYFPDTSTCKQHYTWFYNTHLSTSKGTETDFRTPDDLHVNVQNGMMSWAKTKLNTGSADPHMIYLQFINKNSNIGSVGANDSTRQSLEAVELNMHAEPNSTGSLNGFQCDMTDKSTTGDNANVCMSPNVFKYSGIGKDWGLSIAGYDYSATQPRNVISYTGIENDVQVSGQDMGASLWDPTQGGRHLLWLGANTVHYPNWQPLHVYSVGDKIIDTRKNWIWIVTTPGVSSAGNNPTSNWNPESGHYKNGSVTFTAKLDYHGVVSKAIYIVNDHIDDDYSYFDDGLAVNANVRDASINLTKEILTQPHSASIRLSKNHPIDFSGDATPAGKNQIVAVAREKTIVGKIGLGSSWNIEMNSKPALIVENRNLALNSAGLVRLSISDSAKLKPETLASPVGLTVGHSLFTPDRTDIIYGKNGADILGTNTDGYPHKEPIISLPDKAYREGGKQAVAMGAPLRLLNMSRSEIKNYPAPIIGMEIYDIDDDVPAVYTKKGWKLMLLSDFPSK